MEASSIAVLLCTLNGERFLQEQLDSFARQWHEDTTLWASDDGSIDSTISILESYRVQSPNSTNILKGPGSGHTANFLSLACNSDITADYYAYADQDDIWEAEKLTRALGALAEVTPGRPSLYCARTRAVTIDGRPAGLSPLFTKPPSFANALLQNIGGGNTMVMNRAARELLVEAGNIDVVSHDWWTYLLISAAGGEVIYDSRPSLQYRQHTSNIVGSNRGLRARIRRTHRALQNRSRDWNSTNIAALNTVRHLITEENLVILDQFSRARNAGLLSRVQGVLASGVYTQTLSGNMSLAAAALLKKI